MPRVNPHQITWARETAGLTQERAAELLNVPIIRIAESERDGELTANQFAAIAKLYRRPFVAFYLSEPPAPSDQGEDFRNIPLRTLEPEVEARLNALLRDVRTRQLLIRNILTEDDEATPVKFVGSLARNVSRSTLLAAMRKVVAVELSHLRGQRSPEDVFKLLRLAIEQQGIFVLLAGDLGSHHTAIPVSTFRGFALADSWAPFIVVNDKDAKTAWSFTLLHELAHLLTGASGVSGSSFNTAPIERLCNDVAGEFLLPDDDLGSLGSVIADENSPTSILSAVISFANDRRLSPDLVAYRSYRKNLIDQQNWMDVQKLLSERLHQFRQERAQDADISGGGDYYVVRRHRLGGLVTFARRALDAGVLSPTKAALVLGVKPRNVRALFKAV